MTQLGFSLAWFVACLRLWFWSQLWFLGFVWEVSVMDIWAKTISILFYFIYLFTGLSSNLLIIVKLSNLFKFSIFFHELLLTRITDFWWILMELYWIYLLPVLFKILPKRLSTSLIIIFSQKKHSSMSWELSRSVWLKFFSCNDLGRYWPLWN